MTKKTFLGVMAVATAVALTGGALIASNMGFKLNYTLTQPLSGGTGDTGTSTIALPNFRQAGLNNAKDLMDDVGFANVTNVQKYLKATASLQVYTGRKNVGGPNAFSLQPGEGYFVKMNTTTNYIVVGSHNPGQTYNLGQPLVGGTADNGTNFFAYNYHQTAADAKALMDDIGFVSVTNVQKYLKATASLQVYTGRKNVGGPNAFALTPGEAYYIKMNTTVNPYSPSHY